ncbi:MAG: hypothetical protein F7B20_02310 [Aeropyrum sp.]|nr:hypothetical protein [Aeropyrum sp.]MCE4615808.1 hypothetical protein [Aeropyrum sp.]
MKRCFNGLMLPEAENYQDLVSTNQWISIPGIAPVFLEAGLNAGGIASNTGCLVRLSCGTYQWGFGELVADYLGEPPHGFTMSYSVIRPPKGLEAQSFDEDIVENSVFNPFSWRPLLPIPAPIGGCVESEAGYVSMASIDPAASAPISRCATPSLQKRISTHKVGGSLIEVEGASYGTLLLIATKSFVGVASRSGPMVLDPLEKPATLTIRTGVASHRMTLLYGAATASFKLESASVRANVVSVEGPGLKLSLASPGGVLVVARPGHLEVEFSSILGIVEGRTPQGYRALLELLYTYETMDRAPARLGNFYSVKAHALLQGTSDGAIIIKSVSLEEEGGGTVYFNPPFPASTVEVYAISGVETLPGGPRISLPTPACGCIVAEVKARTSRLLERMRRLRYG